MIRNCPLCRNDFEGRDACRQCGLAQQCSLLRCPQCGYEFVEDSKLLSWILKTWWKFISHRPVPVLPGRPEVVPLSQAQLHQSYRLERIQSSSSSRLNRLNVLGFVPGSKLCVRQCKPVMMIRIGETDVALDTEVVREIFVKPLLGESSAMEGRPTTRDNLECGSGGETFGDTGKENQS